MNQLCKVCGEPAAGFHFGAFTCEGCKSFFGRTYNNLSSLSECKNSGRCEINKKNRTSCKSCRLRKCLTVGMSKSGSRYGRRSNWFKIHCLLQDQASSNGTNGLITSDTATLLANHKLLSTSAATGATSASYEPIREAKHYTSTGSLTDRSSPGDVKVTMSNGTGYRTHHDRHGSVVYGGMETPSPPYERPATNASSNHNHHLPMSPVSPVSPHTAHFVYNSQSPNNLYNHHHNGHLMAAAKTKALHSMHLQSSPYMSSLVAAYDAAALLRTRIVAPTSHRRYVQNHDRYDNDIDMDDDDDEMIIKPADESPSSQDKPIDLSVKPEDSYMTSLPLSAANIRSNSRQSSCHSEFDDDERSRRRGSDIEDGCSPPTLIPETPLDLTCTKA